jgi:hypothetical protein
LPDLARMTRILADLNRLTIARQRQADAGASLSGRPTRAAGGRRDEAKGKGLSEEAYHAIRNALLGIDPFDPSIARNPVKQVPASARWSRGRHRTARDPTTQQPSRMPLWKPVARRNSTQIAAA